MECTAAEQRKTVDVPKMNFAGLLRHVSQSPPNQQEKSLTNRRKKPKSKKNRMGPAKSESSMMC